MIRKPLEIDNPFSPKIIKDKVLVDNDEQEKNKIYFTLFDKDKIIKEIFLHTIPEKVAHSHSAQYMRQNIFGRLTPIIRYTGADSETLSFSIKYHSDMVKDKEGTLTELVNDLLTLSAPSVDRELKTISASKIYYSVAEYSGFGTIQVSPTFHAPIGADGEYLLATISFVITVETDFSAIFKNYSIKYTSLEEAEDGSIIFLEKVFVDHDTAQETIHYAIKDMLPLDMTNIKLIEGGVGYNINENIITNITGNKESNKFFSDAIINRYNRYEDKIKMLNNDIKKAYIDTTSNKDLTKKYDAFSKELATTIKGASSLIDNILDGKQLDDITIYYIKTANIRDTVLFKKGKTMIDSIEFMDEAGNKLGKEEAEKKRQELYDALEIAIRDIYMSIEEASAYGFNT